MAEQSGIKVADLFPDGFELGTSMAEAARADPESETASLPWRLVAGPAGESLRGLLDCDLLELLAKGWLEAKAFRNYADPAKYPPDEIVGVALADHRFVREIHPALEVSLAGCRPVRLRFTVALAASFSGVALSIRDGHILGGTLGDGTVSAQLKYGAVKLTDEKKSRTLKLPGRFSFAAPGLRIPPPDSPRSTSGE
jgi:hypothetical protein